MLDIKEKSLRQFAFMYHITLSDHDFTLTSMYITLLQIMSMSVQNKNVQV